jgi:hypothetical protein
MNRQPEQTRLPTGREIHQMYSPLSVEGECVYCLRTVDGWLGVMLGRMLDEGQPICFACDWRLAEHKCIVCETAADEPIHRMCAESFPTFEAMAQEIVHHILLSGFCWRCDMDIDEDPENVEAYSVGQRRFCKECTENDLVMPQSLDKVVGGVADRWDTLGSFKASQMQVGK